MSVVEWLALVLGIIALALWVIGIHRSYKEEQERQGRITSHLDKIEEIIDRMIERRARERKGEISE